MNVTVRAGLAMLLAATLAVAGIFVSSTTGNFAVFLPASLACIAAFYVVLFRVLDWHYKALRR